MRLLSIFIGLIVISGVAWAQEIAPGDSCAPAETNFITLSGGPELGGNSYKIVCDGSTWNELFNAVGLDREIQFNSGGVLFSSSDLRFDSSGHLYSRFIETGFLRIQDDSPSVHLLDPANDMSWYVGNDAGKNFYVGSWDGATYRNRIWFQDSGNETFMDGELVLNGWGPASATLDVRGTGKFNSGLIVNENGGGGGDFRVEGDTQTHALFVDASSDNVGINQANPSVALDVVGDINYTGSIFDVSDIRLKENIEPIDDALAKLSTLSGFSFTMKDDPDAIVEYGVSAQDVQKVFPELVTVHDPDSGALGVSYNGLIAPMIEAIKEQQAKIEELKAENADLSSLAAKVDALEAQLLKLAEDQ